MKQTKKDSNCISLDGQIKKKNIAPELEKKDWKENKQMHIVDKCLIDKENVNDVWTQETDQVHSSNYNNLNQVSLNRS